MKIDAIQCNKCGDTIFSRARHDYRSCSCGECFVDGGFDYMRVGFKDKDSYINKSLEIDTTKEILYKDWNNRKDKFGLIKAKKKKNSN